jgi:protease-4
LRRLSADTGLAVPAAAGPDSPLGLMLAALEAETAALLRWNDPRHLYTHCLCEAP